MTPGYRYNYFLSRTKVSPSPDPTIDPQPYYVISVDITYGCCASDKFAIDKFSTLEEALAFQKTKGSHATIDTAVIIKEQDNVS